MHNLCVSLLLTIMLFSELSVSATAEAEQRYKQTLSRMKTLLEQERKNLRTVRTQVWL